MISFSPSMTRESSSSVISVIFPFGTAKNRFLLQAVLPIVLTGNFADAVQNGQH
jgi:hypothetical protein